jgi:L-seryl-tRNA(Ser) seleniumtransferase
VDGSTVRVINATGVPLHTNLGRAPLAAAARDALRQAGEGYLNLEYDLNRGRRSIRGEAVESQLKALTTAEAALVVNNNAAAVLLALSALASGQRVLVSRGELIEIGGSYRLPEVFEKSGAILHEVGTTNRTHLRDFERPLSAAVGKRGKPQEPIALVLRAHPSNYRTLGFTARPDLGELVQLCRRHKVPLVEDLGSGALIDFGQWGYEDEPTVQEVLRAGVDLVTFSGDKLLGGPQAGILLGKRKLIEACRKDALARAMRVDKGTLAALEATLSLYFDPERAVEEIPVLRMLSVPVDELWRRAESLAGQLTGIEGLDVKIREAEGEAGGGSLPVCRFPTCVVTLKSARLTASVLETRLRAGDPPLVARIQGGRVWLDVRTLMDDSDSEIAALVRDALGDQRE